MIAVMNQNGGQDKSAATINLGHALAMSGHRVLLLDLDPQGHLTAGFGNVPFDTPGMDTVLLDGEDIDEVLVMMRHNLDLVPAGPRLAGMERLREAGTKLCTRLHDAMLRCDRTYDVVVMDCPPSMGLLCMNALSASREVLIPVLGDNHTPQSLSRFMGTLKNAEQTLRRTVPKRVIQRHDSEDYRVLARELMQSSLF